MSRGRGEELEIENYPLGAFQFVCESAEEDTTKENEQLEDALLPYLAFEWIVTLFLPSLSKPTKGQVLMPDYSSYQAAPFLAFEALVQNTFYTENDSENNNCDDFPALLPDENDALLSFLRTVIKFPFEAATAFATHDDTGYDAYDDDLMPDDNDPFLLMLRKIITFPFQVSSLVLTPFVPSRTPPILKKAPSSDQLKAYGSQDNLQDAASIAGNRLFTGAFGRANKSVRIRNTL